MAGEFFESETIVNNEPKIRYYCILELSEINKINFNDVLETSLDSIKKSLDNLLTFVSYHNVEPECLKNVISKQGPYNEYEISRILNNDNWFDQNLKIEKNLI